MPTDDAAVSGRIGALMRDVPDFPKPGVTFKDLTRVLADPALFTAMADVVAERHRGGVDVVAGVEARGFIVGAAVARALGVGFVAVRKAGKLPGDTVAHAYDLEYGSAEIEVNADAVTPGERVLLVDDVLATGGTAVAAWDLLEQVGGEVVAFECVVELAVLEGRGRLAGRTVGSLHVVE